MVIYLLTTAVFIWGCCNFYAAHKNKNKYKDGRTTKWNPWTDRY